jgi:hypothetical protein
MEYRKLGKTGLKVSEVSLGTEYLINLPRRHVVKVIGRAIDEGVNYFDLFFAQPAFRDNMGAAFAGKRGKAILAAHLGAMDKDGQYQKTRDLGVARNFFEDFLRRYRTDYADVLFLHNCDTQADSRSVMSEEGLLGLARRFRREGKARFVGFSTHTVKTALRAAESGEIDVLMYSVNAASNAVPGRREMLSRCGALGVGVVAMKPYAGGKLLTQASTLELERWHLGGKPRKLKSGRAVETKVTPVQCLSYVLAQPGVTTALPGCKNLSELKAALAVLSASQGEKDFSALVGRYRTYIKGECVYCNHCLPCPARIDIGETMRSLEAVEAEGRPGGTLKHPGRGVRPQDCIECGACEKRCPFGVKVVARMRRAKHSRENRRAGEG